jgi:AcrR family transcriptional regulator
MRPSGLQSSTSLRPLEIASGTLFNYFPTKEAIVATLVAEGLERAADDLSRRKRAGGSVGGGLVPARFGGPEAVEATSDVS